jgi:PIN domain nuclease of toxin-antitoxin system
VKLLLDTCTLLWMAGEPGRLSGRVRGLLSAPDTERWFSAISSFEIAIKARKGKLTLPLPSRNWLREVIATYGLHEFPITSEIAALAPEVSVPHADPCDRIIVATAQIHGVAVATSDPLIHACQDIEVVW